MVHCLGCYSDAGYEGVDSQLSIADGLGGYGVYRLKVGGLLLQSCGMNIRLLPLGVEAERCPQKAALFW